MPTTVTFDMRGKVALVTGGAYGVGRASALAFSRSGANVVIADINAERAAETVELSEEFPGRISFIEADVSVAEDVKRVMAHAESEFGGLDYAHNNAGIIEGRAKVADYSLEQWNRLIQINLTSVFLCVKYEIPLMLTRGGGSIVNVASEAIYRVASQSWCK